MHSFNVFGVQEISPSYVLLILRKKGKGGMGSENFIYRPRFIGLRTELAIELLRFFALPSRIEIEFSSCGRHATGPEYLISIVRRTKCRSDRLTYRLE